MTNEVFQMMHWYWARLTPSRNTTLGSGSFCNSAFFSPKYPLRQRSDSNNMGDWLMPTSHIHGSRRRFHYGSNPTDDPGNDNFRSPIPMFNASTTTYDNGCNTEIYGLIRIATDDAGSYRWLILRQIRECVTWALYTLQHF